ncbi:Endo-1,3(4)-beta-glucanase [Colletotrichum trifolii]|uniref:Endo-1,3(4)-beta-glucanase n=1 Tax=Colletotrichum trifolii TaxID=5466 RepID=A0A4R8RIY1_COLTR|nr:Endo-1,3(4)-beta-glucanase [Colletotrichum trifolii]
MAYSLSHSYFGANIISDFNFVNYPDPSNGFVRYQSQPDALAKGLYSIDPTTEAVTLGVDDTNIYALTEGRPSVRLESKRTYNHGLFIGDFAHMPPSVCGLWPAFWMYGPDWPAGGEIDIIEGANQVTTNILSGHTTAGCRLPDAPEANGQPVLRDCESPGANNNAGCNYLPSPSHQHTYGDSFNAVGGGVYALEWTADDIRIWHWPRQGIPADIVEKKPDPASWGLPIALFGTSTCEVDKYFKDMSIVIQTNFCGDYAANIWGQGDDTCNQRAPTCVEYVANNPSAFKNAYWEVNYIDVYEQGPSNTTVPEPTTTTTIKTTSTVFTTVPNPATILTSTHNGTVLISTVTTQSAAAAASTAPPSPSTDPLVPDREPAVIGEYAFLGCFGSATGFRTFLPKTSAGDMTLQKCVDLCTPGKYAGVRQSECFCADDLDPDTRAEADRSLCDIPCPGNSTQLCGGTVNVSPAPSRLMHLHRRAAPANYLLTIYGRTTDETPPPAPPLGDPEPHVPSTTTVVTTVTYTTVIDAGLIPTEFATTILVPACSKYCAGGNGLPMAVSVPMTTTVAPCSACGPHGENEVTLTVPLQLAAAPATPAATGYWPTGGPIITAPPAGGVGGAAPSPGPPVVSVNSAAGLRLGWSACVVVVAVFRFVLMFA